MNKWVLSLDLNSGRVEEFLTSVGREFQTEGARKLKERSPNVLVLRFETLRSFSHDERRFPSKLTRCSRSLRIFLNQNIMLYMISSQIQNRWSNTRSWIEMKADEKSMKSTRTQESVVSRWLVSRLTSVNVASSTPHPHPAPICKL